MTDAMALLHVLWTKAVGTPGYDKKEWTRMQKYLEDREREDDRKGKKDRRS